MTKDNVHQLPVDSDEDSLEEMLDRLAMLREPVPANEIEKLPKPSYRDAWKDQPKGRCDECGGYHCLTGTIHLDYVGHAGVTARLLEADPFWSWEPLAVDEVGLPRFDRFGGLWIKLTVVGVTRLGYGDAVGKDPGTTAVKEIIGDALRNAAMRFGVALDLWSKLDRHEGKNPGATEESNRGQTSRRQGHDRSGHAGQSQPTPPRAANQDALDTLTAVCDEHGYDTRAIAERWAREHGGQNIRLAEGDAIVKFAADLIEEALIEPDESATTDGGDDAAAVDVTDTSDVEKKDTDLF